MRAAQLILDPAAMACLSRRFRHNVVRLIASALSAACPGVPMRLVGRPYDQPRRVGRRLRRRRPCRRHVEPAPRAGRKR